MDKSQLLALAAAAAAAFCRRCLLPHVVQKQRQGPLNERVCFRKSQFYFKFYLCRTAFAS